ncbi:lipase 3 [Procambarus clarkii]|uniref:lipase 3 n=1 Tax=Procambarus clarkii TaxID=6728 RepID=UPI001E673FC1|nr:lipase 3-like [Procambarus clarkii]XP_045609071.1 lipase 3-like [Procambarus clarkii]
MTLDKKHVLVVVAVTTMLVLAVWQVSVEPRRHSQYTDKPTHSRHRRSQPHPHINMTTPELIKARGYQAEVHQVVTGDGYILEMHRIPHGRSPPSPTQAPPTTQTFHKIEAGRWLLGQMTDNRSSVPTAATSSSGGRPVVFLLHGILLSSADFVMNDPDQALGFMMADAGYDVWIGNNRGNFYGRRHVHLSPEEPEFWEFSWNEMARYDMPAMLGYVLNVSGAAQVSFVGHSMGNSLLFAMMYYYPHLTSWVRVMAAMAPASYIHHKMGPVGLLAHNIDVIDGELRKQGIVELFRLTPDRSSLTNSLCGPHSITNFICIFVHFIIGGENSNYLDREYLPVIFAHMPAGTGLRVFTHLLQIQAARKFQAFDYGEAENMVKYGTTSPPSFPLSRVKIPVGLYWSRNDWIVDKLDLRQTAAELPRVATNYMVPLRGFNHMDFLWAENAYYLVYQPLIQFINEFQ